MERDEQQPAPNGARSDHLDRLRLLVTLQNQIVELARRNQVARQDCVRLSEEITRQVATGKSKDGWIRTAVDYTHQRLRAARERLRAHPFKRPNELTRVTSLQPDLAHGTGGGRASGSVGAENKVETAPPPALRSAVR
jgi:hypothetical protein